MKTAHHTAASTSGHNGDACGSEHPDCQPATTDACGTSTQSQPCGTNDPSCNSNDSSVACATDLSSGSVVSSIDSTDATVATDSSAPVVTDSLDSDGVTITGSADPGATVTLTDGTQTLATEQADGTGAWSIDTGTLTPGTYSLVASETNSAGDTGSAAAIAVTVPARFDITDTVTDDQTLLVGTNYPGPVGYLQAGYSFGGTDNSVISALVGDVFINASTPGENAEVALSGSNVLAAGANSSWLVGANGSGGGNDTFFVSGETAQPTWDTLVNFHVGDMLTLWDFNPTTGSTTQLGLQGASQAKGDTIAVNFGNAADASTLVTFAGVPAGAQFSTATGVTGGHDFLMLTRTA